MSPGVSSTATALIEAATATAQCFTERCRRFLEFGENGELQGLRRDLARMAGLLRLFHEPDLIRQALALDRELRQRHAAASANHDGDRGLARQCLRFTDCWLGAVAGSRWQTGNVGHGLSAEQAARVARHCSALPRSEGDVTVGRYPALPPAIRAMDSLLVITRGQSLPGAGKAPEQTRLRHLCWILVREQPLDAGRQLRTLLQGWLQQLARALDGPRDTAIDDDGLLELMRLRCCLMGLQPFLPSADWSATADRMGALVREYRGRGAVVRQPASGSTLMYALCLLTEQLREDGRVRQPVPRPPRCGEQPVVDCLWQCPEMRRRAAAENEAYLQALTGALDSSFAGQESLPPAASLCTAVYKLSLNLHAMGMYRSQGLARSLYTSLLLALQQRRQPGRWLAMLLRNFHRALDVSAVTGFPQDYRGERVPAVLCHAALTLEAELARAQADELGQPGARAGNDEDGRPLTEYLAGHLRLVPRPRLVIRQLSGSRIPGSALIRRLRFELSLLIEGAHRLRVYRIETLASVLGEIYGYLAAKPERASDVELRALLRRAHRSLPCMLDQAAAWQEVSSARNLIDALYAWLSNQPRVIDRDVSQLLLASRSVNRRLWRLLSSPDTAAGRPGTHLVLDLLRGQEELLRGIAEELPPAYHHRRRQDHSNR